MCGSREISLKPVARTLGSSSALVILAIVAAAGCSKEKSAQSAAADLEKAFQTSTSPAVEAPAQPASVSLPLPEANQAKRLVGQAVSALQTNGYAVAFASLRAAQTAPNMTVDQYDAIEKTRLAVEHEMANKAASGDPNALQSLQTIQSL